MDWYCVFYDAEGENGFVEWCSHEPSELTHRDMAQTKGFFFVGCYQADSEDEAWKMAEQDFTPSRLKDIFDWCYYSMSNYG